MQKTVYFAFGFGTALGLISIKKFWDQTSRFKCPAPDCLYYRLSTNAVSVARDRKEHFDQYPDHVNFIE